MSASVWDARPSHKQVNTPPVVVELPVTEAQQLGREVHGWVKEPVEKHQPQQVVGDLRAQMERRWAGIKHAKEKTGMQRFLLTANLRSLSVILDRSMSYTEAQALQPNKDGTTASEGPISLLLTSNGFMELLMMGTIHWKDMRCTYLDGWREFREKWRFQVCKSLPVESDPPTTGWRRAADKYQHRNHWC